MGKSIILKKYAFIKMKWLGLRLYYYINSLLRTIVPKKFNNSLIINKYINYKPSNLNKICLFAHYDIKNQISESVVNYLRELKENGFAIVFCTTSEEMNPSELKKINNLCFIQIIRKNIGIDFGSWHTGLVILEQQNLSFNNVLFANDSVLGPFTPLRDLFTKLSNSYLARCGQYHHAQVSC